MERLDQLEARSICVLREGYAEFGRLAMLWSIGKDSTVLLWLARKAFFGEVPFPLIHVDTSFKIPEMIAFRDRIVREWRLDLIVGRNDAAISARQTFPDGSIDRVSCCRLLKTEALLAARTDSGARIRFNHKTGEFDPDSSPGEFDALVVGIRADEEGSRSKERYFSARDTSGAWVVRDQSPELWHYFNGGPRGGSHIRVHPLLDWTELDVWEYIERERMQVVSLYFDQGDGFRYRSLGCGPCTARIRSDARTPGEIVSELRDGKLRGTSERASRAQDREDGGGLETLRRAGYM